MRKHSQKTDRAQKPAPRRPWALAWVALGLAVVAGALLSARPLFRGSRASVPLERAVSAPDVGLAAPPEPPSFSGPAFSPEATVDDLKGEAICTVEEIAGAYPDGADALGVAARLHLRLGNSEIAAAVWRQCAELDAACFEAYLGLGQIAGNGGDVEKAAAMFGKAAALAPDDPMAPALQADALLKLGRAEEAVGVLESCVARPGTLDKAMVLLGQAYLQLGQFDKAKQTFEKLIQADPEEARAYYGLARAYARLGESEKSRENLEKFRASGAVDQDDLRLGARTYDDGVKVRALLVETLVDAGRVYRKRGNPAKAEQAWQKAAVLDKKDVPSRFGLVYLYEELGRDGDALWTCEELCRIEPENPDYWLFLGLLYDRFERGEDAQAALQRAVQLAPGNPKYERAYQMTKGEQ